MPRKSQTTEPQPPGQRCRRCTASARDRDAHLRALDDVGRYVFPDAAAVEQHLRLNVPPWRDPPQGGGYSFEDWLRSVLSAWGTWHTQVLREREFILARGGRWPRRPVDPLRLWLDRKYPGGTEAEQNVRAYYLHLADVRSPDQLEHRARTLLTDNAAAPRLLANQLAIVAAWRAHNQHDPAWAGLLPGT